MRRWVCFDVGETLIDETRVWATWADVLGIPRFTFMAALGGVIARGEDHRRVFDVLDVADWAAWEPEVAHTYGGFGVADLYPDAVSALTALSAAGYGVAVLGNQPACRHAELQALGVRVDVLAMSDTLGVAKPDPAFFRRALELMGSPEPSDVAYVGDRLDNDVMPASALGLQSVWLRRGPWGLLQQDRAGTATLGQVPHRAHHAYRPAMAPSTTELTDNTHGNGCIQPRIQRGGH